jgi:aminoglycoside phosphotransferase (APT) family kinase protein
MPGVDQAIALRWAAQAVQRLGELHSWSPTAGAEQTLREPLDHGGFVSRDKLIADVGRIAVEDRTGLVSRSVVEGLAGIAEHAPLEPRTVVPVHADCHWGNWLVGDHGVTALLDFEWARFGEPVDDWFFLARFSGPHQDSVLGIISDVTTKSRDELRAECEVREAAYLTSDLLVALRSQDASPPVALEILRDLENLVVNRTWWRAAR